MRMTILAAAAALLGVADPLCGQTSSGVPPLGGLTGTIDFGFRSEASSGDVARYERFRDLRQGASSHIEFGRDTDQSLFAARLDNIGYRDQRYAASYLGGRTRISGSWDSIPLNYGYATSTPWVETSTGIFSLDPSARLAVQSRTPGVLGIPTTASQAQSASVFRSLAATFDLQSKRDTAAVAAAYSATDDLGVNVTFSSTKRSGRQPYGMSFAFNNANELPMPIDNRTNDASASLEWANTQGMIRVGWEGSWFDNRIREIVWDNPLRATDTNPYDPNGYSNGNGPARGRTSVPPSNSMNVVSTSGLYKMPSRTTISGIVSFTNMAQNEALIPWTINPVISGPAIYADFPGLARLPRATAEAKVHGLNGMFNFTSRPNNFFGLAMRYRFNDHKNLTPAFDATDYVRFDAVPEDVGGVTERFNIRENTFDLTGTFNLLRYTALRLGYVYDDFNRTGRAFSDMRDYTLKASVDTVGNQYVMIRAAFDHTSRVGSGFSEASLEHGGAQPGLRFYDESDRDRDRGSLVFVATPHEMLDVTFQVAAGRDVYKGKGHEFGLLNNDNTTYSIGANVSPIKQVAFGVNYGRETFSSLQNSRHANPDCRLGETPCDPTAYNSFLDPNRTWYLDHDETVNNFDLYVDVRPLARTDIRFGYDYSNSDAAFVHSGPRIQALLSNATLTPGDTRPCPTGASSCFVPLPSVTNKWRRATADVKHYFTERVGVGLAYWYEKFDVADYATIDLSGQPGASRVDYLGEINTGYGNRPYKGSTGFLRLLYRF